MTTTKTRGFAGSSRALAFTSLLCAGSGCGARTDANFDTGSIPSALGGSEGSVGGSGASVAGGGADSSPAGQGTQGGTPLGLGGSGPTGGRAANAGGIASTGGTPANAGGTVSTGGKTANTGGSASTGGATATGTPSISPSGYVTVTAGTTILSGYVSSYVGGSGSSIALSYTDASFCAKGAVGASATYNSWAGVGFNVNQTPSGSSGSTGRLTLVGASITVSYVDTGGSQLELQLWDGSQYWCSYLPVSSSPNSVTIPFSDLKSECWANTGNAFTSGTSITTVQLVVPGSSTVSVPFDYCFLGMTVQ